MNEYKIFVGKDSKDYFECLLKDQYSPSEENTKKINDISERVNQQLTASHLKNEIEFRKLYGDDVLEFIKSISKPNFLSTRQSPFSITWDVKEDYDNDSYWVVGFRKGKFYYQIETCSGYGRTKILEENISTERVLELLYAELKPPTNEPL